MAVDLEAINERLKNVPEPHNGDVPIGIMRVLRCDIPDMIAEIRSLRSTIANLEREIKESRASIKAKQETIDT